MYIRVSEWCVAGDGQGGEGTMRVDTRSLLRHPRLETTPCGLASRVLGWRETEMGPAGLLSHTRAA
jgi:hypothetical protein